MTPDKETLEKLRDNVIKNLDAVQRKIKEHGVDKFEKNSIHHLLIRYAKLLLTIENHIANRPKKPSSRLPTPDSRLPTPDS